MLAQNFKSAADLGITDRHQQALQKTLTLAETGKLVHVDPTTFESVAVGAGFTGHFNMSWWNQSKTCGTCCCLGGTAELIGGLQENELDELADRNPELKNLFYPGMHRQQHLGIDMKKITPKQAATALRSYLTTGDARWDLAIA